MKSIKQKTLELAVYQTSSLAIDSTRIDYFISLAKTRGAKILVVGEYVCNLFFKELEKMPLAIVKAQSDKQFESFKKLATQYNIIIIAPLVVVQKNRAFKTICKFTPKRVYQINQQLLINYPHWNEERFFANELDRLKMPYIFTIDGFRVAILSGFELHFDELWAKLLYKNIDLVIAPTASSFESFARWQTLIKARSLTANCYILRANRIGEYEEDGHKWDFYGNSLITNPFGEIDDALDDEEGLLLATVSKSLISEARGLFGFAKSLKKRKNLIKEDNE